MPESELLARIAKAEQRIKQLEYQLSVLKQIAGRVENTIGHVRSAGAK